MQELEAVAMGVAALAATPVANLEEEQEEEQEEEEEEEEVLVVVAIHRPLGAQELLYHRLLPYTPLQR